ncbi:MAG: FAD-dependent oxidoreductase [Mogibacterium sp.]|nr:FAD-dependent oxidoreductase [Mogibacterium sp.]
MERKYPHLSSPITLGRVTFRNRMFSSPMGGTDITENGCIGPGSRAFYELRAKGGAAAVTVSELMVHPETDGSQAFHLDPALWGTLQSATLCADAIRRHGAIASIELSHSGQFAGTYMTDKSKKAEMVQYGVSPSVRADGMQIRELSKEQIDEIIEAYRKTAALARTAGFEMIMVHGGHGWLINQFLSPMFNKRTDEYGGSLENRTRFAVEVLKAVREAVGPGFPIEFRLSGAEFVPEGYDLDEGIRIAKAIEPYVDLLHVTAGTYQKTFGITHPSMFEDHGRNVYLAAEIKKHVSVPVATIGGLSDPEMMEEIIASGKADVVEMARQLLADHELPRKVVEGRDEDIVHCLRCFTCMAERGVTGTRRCTVNPFIGREMDGMEVVPARESKKVLIAGAGPGGLYASITAAKRGHKVILCEKDSECGGILRGEQALPFKYDMYRLGLTYEKIARDLGVEIRLNTPVTKEYVEAEAPDALIIACGSTPLVPPIPGLKGDNVVVVNNYFLEADKVTDDVVVFGGGLAGCEIAVKLGMEGKNVHIVEMRDRLAPDANIRHRPLLMNEIDKYVTVHTSCKGLEVREDGILCENAEGEQVLIPGTTVICALGQRSNTAAVQELMDSAPFVRVIGDASKVSTITNAVYWGHHAALDI